ncbi:integration host factor subunit alpha [Aromatoleum petrolei]|uniref:Integration host factor subunit alpha n=1 Tax=Aromatoleum petrolei TaxID=76116 RepID=A0ABX1MP71_9RHOO|nr:integration host factor subunit alpha [Aromatoleum petrolei]NMF88121.1 integration host factor subunit alpha [Aromatoleum petrolei]QTQ38908.1 Integration host factor, alpha subunit [Aromatoleum petrolei]
MTLTKADLTQRIADAIGFNKREANEMVEAFFEEIATVLAGGEEVKLSGFGSFQLRQKVARPGRNPKTGETAVVRARRVVAFRPSIKLKGAAGTGKRPSDGTGTAAATHRATHGAEGDIEEFV